MTENNVTGAPIQHLGVVSREQIPSESDLDGDFASSAEAEAAEGAAAGDFDTELTDRDLQTIFDADTAAREAESQRANMGDYVTEGTEGGYAGYEEPGGAIFAQARGQEPRAEEAVYPGSTPSHFPPQTKALSTQPPGHIGSMPHGGPKNPHANAGRAAEQPASGGGSSSTLDQDIAQYRRLVETLRRQRAEERFCEEQRAKEEELTALRREYEQLQSAVS